MLKIRDCNLIFEGHLELSEQVAAVRSFNGKLEGTFNCKDRIDVEITVEKKSSLGQPSLDICAI